VKFYEAYQESWQRRKFRTCILPISQRIDDQGMDIFYGNIDFLVNLGSKVPTNAFKREKKIQALGFEVSFEIL